MTWSTTSLVAGNEQVDNEPQGATSENHIQFATYHQENLGVPLQLGTYRKYNLLILFADSHICRSTTLPTPPSQ